MPVELTDPLVSPWRAPAKQLTPLHTPQLPETTWHVRKPRVAGDLQSTSTVTTTPSRSSSSTSSPLSTANQPPPTTWHLDEYDDDQVVTPPTTPPAHHPPSVRTLPRCGLVNFRKDGDSLRWAPRVTHNGSGVAARVHNFEDAFSLEEFSSRALPVVWRSKGGNPRLSDLAKSDRNDEQIVARSARSTPTSAAKPPPPPKRSLHPMEKRAKSMGPSQRALVRNTSVKKAVVLAAEATRPSFWSLLAHTSKYQRSKAKARLQNDGKKPTKKPPRTPVPRPSPVADTDAAVVPRKPWVAFTGRKQANSKNSRGGKATRRAPETAEKKPASLFQRLVAHLDRRNTKKTGVQDKVRPQSVDANRMAFSSSSDSDDKLVFADKPKGVFRQARHSEGYSNRRVVSALASHAPRKERRQLTRVTSQDDQYVTFITSVP